MRRKTRKNAVNKMVRDNTSQDFGQKAVDSIRAYIKSNKTTWSKLTGDVVGPIIQRCYEEYTGQQTEIPLDSQAAANPELGRTSRTRTNTPKRNPLFDALYVFTSGGDLDGMTKRETRACAVALSEAVKCTPDLTPEEIKRRAELYSKKYPTATKSPSALVRHWSEFAKKPERIPLSHSINVEPPNWKNRFCECFPNIEPPENWMDLSNVLRRDVIQRTS